MKRDLLDRLPVISRARDYRLYSSGGRRIVDFYQDGGNAVLGHRVPGISLSMKQAIEKGVFFSCRTRYDSRLKKAVELLSGRNIDFSVFPGEEALFSALGIDLPSFFPERENEKSSVKNKKEKTESHNKAASTDTVFWHPFSGDSLKELLNNYSFVVPVIPFPGTLSPRIVLSASSSLPASGQVSPVVLAAYITAVYNLINFSESDLYKIWDSEEEYIRRLWRIKGIYLIPCYEEHFHKKIFINLLEQGYLISPDYSVPSILPGKISKGEMNNFIKTVINIAGEIF